MGKCLELSFPIGLQSKSAIALRNFLQSLSELELALLHKWTTLEIGSRRNDPGMTSRDLEEEKERWD